MSRFINAELESDSESDSETESKSDTKLMTKLKSGSDSDSQIALFTHFKQVKNLVDFSTLSKSKHILIHFLSA